MNESYTQRSIDSLIEQRKTLWTVFIVLTGGVVTLYLNYNSIEARALMFVGLIFDIVLFLSIYNLNKQLNSFLNELMEN